MRHRPLTHCIAIVAMVASTAAAGEQGTSSASVAPRSLPVGTCINMGNSLEPEQEGAWGGEPISREDFTRIAAAGFDTVRIPVRWHNKSLSEAPYTVDAEWMDRVQEVVDWALAADLNVILNSHHFDPIYDNPLAVAQWHGGVWEQIAAQFAEYPEQSLWFELENEPHNEFDHTNLLETLAPALTAVRATNPTRAVIYGGEEWSGIDSLATLPLPDDANVYPTFHYYDPFPFTHQGADWVAPDIPEPGRSFGSEADLAQLGRDVAKVEAYIERTGKVPFMGETGAYDRHVATADRARYHRTVREAFAPTGIGICTWAYSNTFPFWDRGSGKWLPGMLAALGLEEDTASSQSAPKPKKVVQVDAVAPRDRRLTPELKELDKLLPGDLVNDPGSLAWDTYGDALRSRTVVDPSIPGGGAALQFANRRAGESFTAGVNIPILADITSGQTVTIGFWARTLESTAPDQAGRISVRIQQNSEPYPGFGDTELSVGPDWKFYEVTATADRDILRRDAIAALQFGTFEQVVEVGQAIIVLGANSIVG